MAHFFCLIICQPNVMKPDEEMGHGQRKKNPLNFGADPNHFL